MNLDIQKIAQAIDDMGGKLPGGFEGGETKGAPKEGPSFFPDLMHPDKEEVPTNVKHRKSMLDTASAIAVVALLKKELHKIGCTLKDYRIEFTLNGVDINNIKVGTPNIEDLRKKIDKLDDADKARISDKVTSMALVAINDPLKERIKKEMGLDISFFEYEKADVGAASLGIAKEEEKPEMPPPAPMPMPTDMGAGQPPLEGVPGAEAELGALPPAGEEAAPEVVEPALEGSPKSEAEAPAPAEEEEGLPPPPPAI